MREESATGALDIPRDIAASVTNLKSSDFYTKTAKNLDTVSAVCITASGLGEEVTGMYEGGADERSDVLDLDSSGMTELASLHWTIANSRLSLKSVYETYGPTNGHNGSSSKNGDTKNIPAMVQEMRSFADRLRARRRAITMCMCDYARLQGCVQLMDAFRMQIKALLDRRAKVDTAQTHIENLLATPAWDRMPYEDVYLHNFIKAVNKQVAAENAVAGMLTPASSSRHAHAHDVWRQPPKPGQAFADTGILLTGLSNVQVCMPIKICMR